MRMRFVAAFWAVLVCSFYVVNVARGQQAASEAHNGAAALTNQDIVLMAKAKFDDGTIVKTIQTHDTNFDLSVAALVKLKDAGVSQPVLQAMLATVSSRGEAGKAETAVAAAAATPGSGMKEWRCMALEYRQFDFWVGDWDAFEVGKPEIVVARAKVRSILDGCVLLEEYDAPDGMSGKSFSIYDASREKWHQTWVTNSGRLLEIEGGWHAGEMVLEGVDYPNGAERRVRCVWKAEEGGVRETAETSTDGGKTWTPWFDLMFRAHRP